MNQIAEKRMIYVVFFLGMLIASSCAIVLKPNKSLSQSLSPVTLEAMIPNAFADWHALPSNHTSFVNPELNDTLSQTYDQILSRLYVSSHQTVIMVSIAYGENQMKKDTIHLPVVCYPAQGFYLSKGPFRRDIATRYGYLGLSQFVAEKPGRIENVSYWIMMGQHNATNAWTMKAWQVMYGLKGYMPDGLIFRISSIGADPQQAFEVQSDFLKQLVEALSPQERLRLTGLGH